MKKVAIIPLRKGSKSIKNKNRRLIAGRPLFSWVLLEAIKSDLDEVYIFTDDTKIIEFVKSEYYWCEKVHVLERSEKNAVDEASTESAMKEFAGIIEHNFEILVLLQATSPLTTFKDINKVINKICIENFDSALTAVRTKRFLWDENGTSLNYNYNKRPRRQEFKGIIVENGAVYATTIKQFRESGIRIGGSIAVVEMEENSLIEIDEPTDWTIAEELIFAKMKQNKKEGCGIKLAVFDVDGVFTSGKVTVNSQGEYSKDFSKIDGMGISLLSSSGVEIIVITSEDSEIVKCRMEKIDVDELYMGVKDKYALMEKLLIEKKMKRNQVAYVGDDINDLANIASVGWGICPRDATLEIKSKADIILKNRSGEKVVREVSDYIIKYNKRYEEVKL